MVQFAGHRRKVEGVACGAGKGSTWSLLSLLCLVSHLTVAFVAFQGGIVVGNRRGTPSSRLDSLQPSLQQEGRQLFPSDMEKLFAGSASVPRDDFIERYDIGVPWDEPLRGAKDVLLMYGSPSSLPDGHLEKGGVNGIVHYMSAVEAAANCNVLKVVLTEPRQENVCLAIVPQWDSFHVHHYMRLKPDDDSSDEPYISPQYPLRYVSRRHEVTAKGIKISPQFPLDFQTRNYWPMLIDYLQKLEATTERLRPIAEKVAGKGNTVVVMVCNFGQSELLINFVCSARAQGLDVSTVLIFATDEETTELATSLGMSVFDVGDAFGTMPKTAAQKYGDRSFREMMLSKVYCVHLINAMGYDLLFQDVDVIWRRNALEYFHSKESGDFDFYFQDDGAHSNRYTPYSPNSGFYYVRQNKRTKYFFEVFIRMGELIIASGSHQSVLNGLLTDHSSSTGLRVKVFQRDSVLGRDFPGGYHFHKRKNFMKDVIEGRKTPYIFHMSWTENKANKQRFYQQLGEWYVNNECVNKPLKEIKLDGKGDLASSCCSAKPIIVCNYSDKPSKIPCKESPVMDHDGKSFW